MLQKLIAGLMVNTVPVTAAFLLNEYWIVKGLVLCMKAAFYFFMWLDEWWRTQQVVPDLQN